MNLEQITDLFNRLSQAVKDEQIEWILTANTRYETNWETQDIVVDRRNNVNKNSPEVYLKVGEFEATYLPDTQEYTYLTEILDNIQWKP